MLHRPHVCPTPNPTGLPHGCIWRCEKTDSNSFVDNTQACGKVWRLTAPGNPRYTYWYRLGRFGRWRHRKLIATETKDES